jgi:hypothetical protein
MMLMRMMTMKGTLPHPLLLLRHPTPAPLVAATEVIAINEEKPTKMVPKQEAPKAHKVVLVDVEPELPQSCLFNVIMRGYVV